MTQPDCDFCDIIQQEEPAREVLRTQHVVAFFPLEPATLGHTLLVPRRHVPDIWSVSAGMATHLTAATLKLAHAVNQALHPEGLNIIQSNGEAATQSVFHLHIHIVPRWSNDGMGQIWPTTGSTALPSKMTQAQKSIRHALGSSSGWARDE